MRSNPPTSSACNLRAKASTSALDTMSSLLRTAANAARASPLERCLNASTVPNWLTSADSAEVNQFGTVLAFKQRSKGEAQAALAAVRSSDDIVSSAEVDGLARKLQAEEVGGCSA